MQPYPLTVCSFRSLPRFPLTNISRLATIVGEGQGGLVLVFKRDFFSLIPHL